MGNMVKLRRILLWITLIGTANLALVSVLSAFMGQKKAWELFNSILLIIGWVGLTGLLMAGLVFFPRLLRKPGLLAMHLGCMLILLGGMLGSKAGLKWMDAFKDHKRVYEGFMTIHDGETVEDVTDGMGKHFDATAFSVQCEKFRIEYYPYEHKLGVMVTEMVKTGRWHRVREHVGRHEGQHAGPHDESHYKMVLKEKEEAESESKRFKWKEGKWQDLPLTDDIKIRVTDFKIQPSVSEPLILVPPRKAHLFAQTAPAKAGQIFRIMPDQPMSVVGRVRHTYMSRLMPHPRDPSRPYDAPDDGPGSSPIAEVVIEIPGGRTFICTKGIAEAVGPDDRLGLPAGRVTYLPAAEAKKEKDHEHSGPIIVIDGPNGPQHVPAEVGREFVVRTDDGRTLSGIIKRLCSVRLVDDADNVGRRIAVESKGADAKPAAEVVISFVRDVITARTPGMTAKMTSMGQGGGLVYIPADNPKKMKGMERPKITFEVKRGGRREKGTITIRKGLGPMIEFELDRPERSPEQDRIITNILNAGRVPLIALYDSYAAWFKAGRPCLFAADEPPHKEYLSHLVVREDGKEVARKTIEVNHPLHYGGYHFYQSGYDKTDLAYTVIAVKSDAGWGIALAGMIVLMLGTTLHFWFEPIWKAVVKKRTEKGRQATERIAGEVDA